MNKYCFYQIAWGILCFICLPIIFLNLEIAIGAFLGFSLILLANFFDNVVGNLEEIKKYYEQNKK